MDNKAFDSTMNNGTSDFTEVPDIVPDDSGGFILIPLIVLFGILILSALVYLMARNRRRLEHIYCKRKLRFKYGDKYYNDENASLLRDDGPDDPTEYLLNGKLEIESRYNNSYSTTNMGHDTNNTKATGELFS